MRRRQFIVGLWGAFGWASMTLAQGSGKLPIVGFLNSASAEGYGIMAAAFKAGLADSGYVEPDNVIVEYRWANDDYTRLPALAADLVSRRVDVIFANSPSITSAQAATKTIPIVFLSGDDPVRLGVVTSLNKPREIPPVWLFSRASLPANGWASCTSLSPSRKRLPCSSTRISVRPGVSKPMSRRGRSPLT